LAAPKKLVDFQFDCGAEISKKIRKFLLCVTWPFAAYLLERLDPKFKFNVSPVTINCLLSDKMPASI
jgi:hypothetical protein